MTSTLNRLLGYEALRLPAGHILCVEIDELAAALPGLRKDVAVTAFSTRRRAWLPPDLPPVRAVVMGFSPAKEQVRMQLAMLAEFLAPGTPLWLYGPGQTGIGSAPRLLEGDWTHIEKVGYGGHAEIWRAELIETHPRAGLAAWQEYFVADIACEAFRVVTLPGVFSHGEVDPGTRLLLENLPRLPSKARVLDFGCGCGIIAAFLKLRQPDLDVHGSDISALALAASKATLKANLFEATLHLESEIGLLPGTFGAIISNPPFHVGQKVELATARALISGAKSKLTKGGRLILVANRFLPYRTAMEKEFGSVKVLADTPQYWVLSSTL